MFPSARWKAYLKDLQESEADPEGSCPAPNRTIYHIYHSQKIWFTQEKDNGHAKSAQINLAKCDALLEECTTMVDNLEATLANTPKPSEVLDWSRLW